MTKSQVRAKLGRPPVVSRFHPHVTYYYGRLRVKLRQGLGVVEVQTTSRTERTRTGVGIGSTERQVVAGVSGVVCSPWVGTIRRCRVGTGEIGTRVTDFLLMNDTVLDLTIARVPDTTPPSAPSNLTVTATTKTSVSLAWTAASDNVSVRAYTLYRNGMRVGKTTDAAATIGGLSCGATDEFGVEAVDPAENRSPRVAIRASTDPCPEPEAPDTTAPSAPSNLTVTATTTTSASLAWTAASDNVGVRAYGLYRNGMRVGTTTVTTATIAGLSCGATAKFGVDAVDAAGNRSPRVTIGASTDPCPEDPESRNLAVSPSGSDANPCTPNAPCRTFNRAYRVALPGDVVEVAAGTYPTQIIANDASKTSTVDVVFRPAPGASVTIDMLRVGGGPDKLPGGDHIEFRDFKVGTVPTQSSPGAVLAYNGATDITFRNLDAGTLWIVGTARNISVLGGDYGPAVRNNLTIKGDLANNILLDGLHIHDIAVNEEWQHSECLSIYGGDNITIRNSRFERCKDYDIFIQPGGDSSRTTTISRVTLENNVFDVPISFQWGDCGQRVDLCPEPTPTERLGNPPFTGERGGNAVRFGPSCSRCNIDRVDIRFNSFLGNLSVGYTTASGGTTTSVTITGNIEIHTDRACGTAVHRNNLYWNGDRANPGPGVPCDATDTAAAPGFIDPVIGPLETPSDLYFDARLIEGAKAIDLITDTTFCVRGGDIDGNARPQRLRCDAGAYEKP